jgi:5-methylcytosine-specific restriction protein A
MSRAIDKEWIGATDDQAIPSRVKIRTFKLYGGKCAICTNPVTHAAYDHRQALINGGSHRESNLQLLCVPCHKVKTRADVEEKSVTARVFAKHIGIKKPRTITRWRRFNGSIREAGRER